MTSLAERLDSFPEAWRPKQPGEKLIGELTDVDMRDSEYGEPYPILTVLDESDGVEKAWHAFHTMARNAVAKKRPQIGERIGIVYAGVGEAQPGMNAPVRWRLLVDRPKETVDYDAVAAEPAEPAVDGEDAQDGDDDIPF
jgi:hypothetical protein